MRQVIAREALRYLPLIVRLPVPARSTFHTQALRCAISLAVSSAGKEIDTFSALRALSVQLDQLTLTRKAIPNDLLSMDFTLAQSSAMSLLDALTITPTTDLEKLRLAIDPLSDGSPRMQDCKAPSETMFRNPLWRDSIQISFGAYVFTSSSLNVDYQNSVNGFWRDWYQGFLDGKPLDWELQRRVALIPDDDWEKGPAHIADVIADIQAEFLASKLPQAESVEFDFEDGKFFVQPTPLTNPDLLGATLSHIQDVLDDALANPSNGLNENSRETRVLKRVFTKYGNDPQRIELDLTSVHMGLTRQIVSQDLPPSEENLSLQSAVEQGAQAVRATHPDVADNRRILSNQALREITAEQKETLRQALPVLRAISSADLAEEWDQDIPALINDAIGPVSGTAPRLPGADEATRIFSRVSKIAILWRKTPEIVKRIKSSPGYAAAEIVLTVSGIIALGIAVLSIF